MTRQEFGRVFSSGRRVHTPLLSVVVSPDMPFKAAVVVSKKVAKGAVARNKLRRRIYALLRERDLARGGYIVILKPSVKYESTERIAEALHGALGKLFHSR